MRVTVWHKVLRCDGDAYAAAQCICALLTISVPPNASAHYLCAKVAQYVSFRDVPVMSSRMTALGLSRRTGPSETSTS
jgi:hypothetical protein